jgi:hypothetical protein
MFEKHLRRYHRLWMVSLCTIVFIITYYSQVRAEGADALGTLLTAQTIVQHGTVDLDVYPTAKFIYSTYIKNGHRFYIFPIGTPLYATPFVWVANLMEKDMSVLVDSKNRYLSNFSHDRDLQNFLSAFTSGFTCLLVFLLARYYINYSGVFLISIAFVFGSSIISTMGTALWSINLTVIFVLLSLIMISSYERYSKKISPYILSHLIFSAYLCRPTAALFIMILLIYLFVRIQHLVILVVLTTTLLFGSFILFSLYTYQEIVPVYYNPIRIQHADTFWTAVCGNLISPARGLFVYSPYLILTMIGMVRFFKNLAQNLLFWAMLGWITLHIIVISRYPHWWGGWGYGTRLITDALPAMLILTLLVWQQAQLQLSIVLRRSVVALFVGLTATAIFINSYQGLYNIYTMEWNMRPNIDTHLEYLFDWKHPPFLASSESLRERERSSRSSR